MIIGEKILRIMEYQFKWSKDLASAIIVRVHEENLPITIRKGKERIDKDGVRKVEISLECDSEKMVFELLGEELTKMSNNNVCG